MKPIAKLTLLLPLMLVAAACGNDQAETATPDMPKTSNDNAAAGGTGMQRSPSPDGARLYFVGIADGDVVQSPVHVEFGLDGMDVVPAGTEAAASGHHHIIIDAELPPLDRPIPADAHHIHFGDGSTATDLALAPGEHSLQLLLGDHLHIPHQPPVTSAKITITVE